MWCSRSWSAAYHPVTSAGCRHFAQRLRTGASADQLWSAGRAAPQTTERLIPFGSPLTAVPTTGPQEESCRAQKPCLAQPRVAWSASYCPHPPDSQAGCRLTGRCGSRGTARAAGCCEERTDVPGSAEAARTSRAYVLAAWMAPWRDPWSSSTRKRTTGLLPSPARSSREGIPKAEVACGRAVPQSRRQQTWRAA